MNETWKPFHDGYYEASDLGNVRRAACGVNTFAGRPKTPSETRTGYMLLGLFILGKRTNCFVHTAVTQAFLGPRPDGYQVNHIDGNKKNNALSNLEYVTPQENMTHAAENGLVARGKTHGTVTHPEKIKRGADHWTRHKPERTASGDRNGSRARPETLMRGESVWSSKLTAEEVVEIRRYYALGRNCSEIGRLFGCSPQNVTQIIKRNTWRHVA